VTAGRCGGIPRASCISGTGRRNGNASTWSSNPTAASRAAARARCKLEYSEREQHAEVYALDRNLLQLRREDPAFRAHRQSGVDGAVLGPGAFVLRYFVDDGDDRLLLVNVGRDLHLDPAPKPLLVPPDGRRWEVRWSSEDPRYGGNNTAAAETDENCRIRGRPRWCSSPECGRGLSLE
jgi:maltooligosyltrehalose trehalohydrolase